MTGLTFTLRGEPDQRLDLTAMAPDMMLGRSAAEIEKIEIGTTKRSVKVGDAFKVKLGDVHDVHYEGGSSRLDCLGAKLLPGFAITVNGDVGAQLGRLAGGQAEGRRRHPQVGIAHRPHHHIVHVGLGAQGVG
ncbi:MAG: hypothetical protein N2444_00565, partial [Methylocystis sp.]|nr:hypothetical protein [Methylocystis sp.]